MVKLITHNGKGLPLPKAYDILKNMINVATCGITLWDTINGWISGHPTEGAIFKMSGKITSDMKKVESLIQMLRAIKSDGVDWDLVINE